MKDEIKYKTAGGNTVTWTRHPENVQPLFGPGEYQCGGCGDKANGRHTDADKHAQGCRAL
ncbi:hypothetical protein [Nonomuraea turcica]|uniref:hypothetical protein n=1 Tax=Nonomuraea sp. G32 TaxID=3067274 RepID=UPI00273B2915|nr:hypothetical protein [Nonomuraea sp. G32]MDP4501111.1 hypothetical protein [Nonomuraea sp. G32]